uniref:PPIase FKBP-type domain-containing protein n=1 Tax=Pyrodinium bahamense TaxID=73915 RepID=A0A7S0A7X6_9DINO|mmetsp:Transcript_26023/g.71593  ORF Transcript_26023/g.71593 Transcript_26023/m.71593 type:complete len:137 (+) Transcript_26023:51-461(+)
MGRMRAALLCLLCATSLKLAEGAGAKRRYISERPLERVGCDEKERVKRGDKVTIQMSANANTNQETFSSEGAAEKEFVVGRHEIEPINKGVIGMCVGESRRIRVVFEQEPGMESDPLNYDVKLIRNDNARVLIKEL